MTCHATRWLFLRLLGLVFLVAFVSLWVQIDGLIGSEGILPVEQMLERARAVLGVGAWRQLPTLAWIDGSDRFLHLLCAAGVGLSLLLILGVAPLPVLVLLWLVYLSLAHAGQAFLGFQWDNLLLETCCLAWFVAPWQLRPRLPRSQRAPRRSGIWLLRLLMFKLMVLSGLVKLLVLDETWWGLTALDYHFYTQPIPTWTSWYAHHLPGWFQKLSVFVMFLIEIVAPLFIFFHRRLRLVACLALMLLQLLIAATGNFTFFNLLTFVICIPLLDDGFLLRLVPQPIRPWFRGGDEAKPAESRAAAGRSFTRQVLRRAGVRAVPRLLAGFVALLLVVSFVEELVRTRPRQGVDGVAGTLLGWGEAGVLSWGGPLMKSIRPLRTINGYGLFRAMTTSRPEIVIEGSRDGRNWREIEFRWKPGAVDRRPGFVAPHQPRLDWQMWFAALAPRRNGYWLQSLCYGILEGRPPVLDLLEASPFPEAPPRHVRLVYYEYRFTTPAERANSGNWWKRDKRATGQPLTLP